MMKVHKRKKTRAKRKLLPPNQMHPWRFKQENQDNPIRNMVRFLFF
jgi:hypothetical protein